jgi:hypothetical protein
MEVRLEAIKAGFGREFLVFRRTTLREITSNLSNSFMTMDTAGMIRPKTVEGATANRASYLINHSPAPNDPMVQAHRDALESLAILGDKLVPRKEGSGSKHPKDARNDITQSKIDKACRRPQEKATTVRTLKKPKNTMVSYEVQNA